LPTITLGFMVMRSSSSTSFIKHASTTFYNTLPIVTDNLF
jgi:hypothetical protein